MRGPILSESIYDEGLLYLYFSDVSITSPFRKFCMETSLHGWAYINREPVGIRKIVWLLFLTAVSVLSIFSVFKNSEQVQIKRKTI